MNIFSLYATLNSFDARLPDREIFKGLKFILDGKYKLALFSVLVGKPLPLNFLLARDLFIVRDYAYSGNVRQIYAFRGCKYVKNIFPG